MEKVYYDAQVNEIGIYSTITKEFIFNSKKFTCIYAYNIDELLSFGHLIELGEI